MRCEGASVGEASVKDLLLSKEEKDSSFFLTWICPHVMSRISAAFLSPWRMVIWEHSQHIEEGERETWGETGSLITLFSYWFNSPEWFLDSTLCGIKVSLSHEAVFFFFFCYISQSHPSRYIPDLLRFNSRTISSRKSSLIPTPF